MGGTFTCLAQDGLITHLLGGVARTNLAVRAVDAATKASHGVDWGAIITRIGVPLGVAASIAAILAIIPMTRTVMVRFWRALSLEIGLPYRRYAKKFIKQFGVYDNPYLGESEQFDLRLTYVPLLVQIAGAQTVKLASDVLADHTARRLIIIGDPGSGKSTLLKAYAVGVLSGRRALASGPKPVPYFIQVRKLAKFLSPERGLADFIVDEILVKGGYFRADMATKFFVDTLRRRRAIVMLDGLDEVHEALQPDVLAAVRSFTTDLTIGRPTAQAVVLLTCRTQNFKSLRENWVPAVASRQSVYSLVPLRDAEIIDYLHRFRHKFGAADGPAQFMKSVRAAGTLDRLRAPLILAMAVGLYARQPERMPSTVTELYKCMIEEMLDRNSFRHENPEYGLNRYKMRDKYRFLRQFSLHAVETSGEFIEFTRSALNKFAGTLTGNLEEVDDTVAMVAEIIKRSGLLSDVSGEESDGQRFVFAHQSIQEFLTSQELRQRGDGDYFLGSRATVPNWRQTTLFYTAGQEAESVDGFLSELNRRNTDLAAHCLQAAKPSNYVARTVLDALEPMTGDKLSALAAAARSSQTAIREMAISQLKDFIIDSVDAFSAGGVGVDGMLPVLDSLADADAAEIAALVPRVIRNLPDDPRLVGPLWRCLNADSIESHPQECGEIVQRLLTLVMDVAAFAGLSRQDPQDREFFTRLRPQAYPFRSALPPRHNIVTLLAWAEYLGVTPASPNRFFEAKEAGCLSQVEIDRRRAKSLSLCWPGRIVSGLELLAAVPGAIVVLAAHPGSLMNPFGWHTLLLIFFAELAGPLLYTFVFDSKGTPEPLQGIAVFGEIPDITGNIISAIPENWRRLDPLPQLLIYSAPIALVPLIKPFLPGYFVLSAAAVLIFMMTSIHAFDRDIRYYIYKPSEFVDMYEDPKSRHWITQPNES